MATIPATADFNGSSLSVITLQNDAWFTAHDIGRALGYERSNDQVQKIFRRHREELEQYSITAKLAENLDGGRPSRLFNEEGVMIITMLSRQPKAAEFRRWAVQVLKAYRHGLLAPALPEPVEPDPNQMTISKDDYIALLEERCELLKARAESRPRRRALSSDERQSILRLARQGHGPTEIARRVGRTKGTVVTAIRQARKGGAL
ncbi:hypothetical protein Q673_06235 [Marinobacter sp. EN3]|uniref:BRO family protein n=1 Tax=Marinobacter sp. EN3 TaxID=1397533 RepID=UPI0003B90A1E|nr:BRO family protein [Marinobacter sp. EN3]ERS04811.1 hypothetical protein Q673_06235 [Marinobacter sp. EN3]